jgi:subtilase family serine protease
MVRVQRGEIMRWVALLTAGLLMATGLEPVRAADAVRLAQLVPAWAKPAARIGPVARDRTIAIELILPWRDPAAVSALVEAVSDPASPNYGAFLTSEEFRARFAPSPSTVTAAVSWLRSRGLEVGSLPENRVVIPARGSVSEIERAFDVTLSRYRVGALALRAPDAPPALPDALARAGILVRGLDDSSALLTPGEPLVPSAFANSRAIAADPPPAAPETPASDADAAPPNAIRYAQPCSAHDGQRMETKAPPLAGRRQPDVACATSVAALRSAYGVDAMLRRGIDGRGQTIVMIGSHSIRPLAGDLSRWSARYGLPRLRTGQFRQFSYPGAYQTPADPVQTVLRPQVWAVQTSMMFETMRAIAPGADYLYVGSVSSLDLQNAMLLAVDRHFGDVVINGWYAADEGGVLPSDTAPIDRAAEQAAATGISLLFASGDLGDNAKFNATQTGPTPVADGVTVQNVVAVPGHPSVSFPAHNPLVTAVGATSLLLGPGGTYRRELGWAKSTRTLANGRWSGRDPALYRASGGGTSSIYDQPAYQQNLVPENLRERPDGTSGRTVPDIAVNGDAESGLSIGYTQHFSDGTNRYAERRVNADTTATALFGAMLTLVNQRRGRALGFVNPALYAFARSSPTSFRDITLAGGTKAGVRWEYIDAAHSAMGTKATLKTFEEFGTNLPRRGYDTCTGIGSPGVGFLARL